MKLSMFALLLFAVTFSGFSETIIKDQTFASGGKTVWSPSGSPYYLSGTITIEREHTLTIEPGTEIALGSKAELKIIGSLIAEGTFEDSIVFKSNAYGGWKRILLSADTLSQVSFKFCHISGAENGLFDAAKTGSQVSIEHCTFSECKYGYINASGRPDRKFTNCIFYSNDYGISCYGIQLTGCLLYNNGVNRVELSTRTPLPMKLHNCTIDDYFEIEVPLATHILQQSPCEVDVYADFVHDDAIEIKNSFVSNLHIDHTRLIEGKDTAICNGDLISSFNDFSLNLDLTNTFGHLTWFSSSINLKCFVYNGMTTEILEDWVQVEKYSISECQHNNVFSNPSAGDYSLRSGMPYTDKAVVDYDLPETDVYNNPRKSNGTVDIGAAEYVSHPEILRQTINYNAGANLISFFVIPQVAKPDSVFKNETSSWILKSENQLYANMKPSYLQTLKVIKPAEGYVFTAEEAGSVSITGCPAFQGSATISLTEGWNLIASPYTESISVEDFFGESVQYLQTIKDDSVFFTIETNPQGTLSQLLPGNAYYVKMSQRADIQLRRIAKQNTPPVEPVLVSPAENAIDRLTSTTLIWESYDIENDPISYIVLFGRKNGMLDTVVSNTSFNFLTIDTLSYDTEYAWQVLAYDQFFDTTRSSLSYFTTETELLGDSGTVTDIDANNYKWVRIGSQIWFAENLKTETYNDGSLIYNEHTQPAWSNPTRGHFAYLFDKVENKDTYGAYYNWYAVDSKILCPKGWRVPTYSDWQELVSYTNSKFDASSLKDSTAGYWNGYVGTNATGFAALSGGEISTYGIFADVDDQGNWWSSTEVDMGSANSLRIGDNPNWASTYEYDGAYKQEGLNVRCIKE